MATTRQAGRDWAGLMQERVLGLQDWRAGHPQATFAELAGEVDRRWRVVRAALRADLALASAATAGAAAPTVPCPQCGGTPFRDAGPRARTVRTRGHAPVTLRRADATCPQCGYRLFPSGRCAGAAAQPPLLAAGGGAGGAAGAHGGLRRGRRPAGAGGGRDGWA